MAAISLSPFNFTSNTMAQVKEGLLTAALKAGKGKDDPEVADLVRSLRKDIAANPDIKIGNPDIQSLVDAQKKSDTTKKSKIIGDSFETKDGKTTFKEGTGSGEMTDKPQVGTPQDMKA